MSKKRFILSMRTLIILVPICVAIVSALIASSVREAERVAASNANERECIRVIEQHGGTVKVDRSSLPWLVALFSRESKASYVYEVHFSPHRSQYFTQLRPSAFPRSPELFDALCRLGCPGIRLNVRGSDFNSRDLRQLSRSQFYAIEAAGTLLDDDLAGFDPPPRLDFFEASRTEFGDVGLCQIAKANLKYIALHGTPVSDRGVECLRKHVPATLVDADLDDTRVSSEGVRMLCEIESLRTLYVPPVSDPEVSELRRKRFPPRLSFTNPS